MSSDKNKITTADKIIINRGSKDFPETDLYIRQPSSNKYKALVSGKPTIEISQYVMAELVHKLFEQKLVEDYTIQYEEKIDNGGRNLPSKTVAYLYLKEQEADYEN